MFHFCDRSFICHRCGDNDLPICDLCQTRDLLFESLWKQQSESQTQTHYNMFYSDALDLCMIMVMFDDIVTM